MPEKSGPFGFAWSQAVLLGKAELFYHPQTPCQARRKWPGPSQGSAGWFSAPWTWVRWKIPLKLRRYRAKEQEAGVRRRPGLWYSSGAKATHDARPGRTEASGAPRGQASGQGGWERAGWADTEFLLISPISPEPPT